MPTLQPIFQDIREYFANLSSILHKLFQLIAIKYFQHRNIYQAAHDHFHAHQNDRTCTFSARYCSHKFINMLNIYLNYVHFSAHLSTLIKILSTLCSEYFIVSTKMTVRRRAADCSSNRCTRQCYQRICVARNSKFQGIERFALCSTQKNTTYFKFD